jgi:hypothetical protein
MLRPHHAKFGGTGRYSAMRERQEQNAMRERMAGLRCHLVALQYHCHTSRVLRLRADADARREFQLMTREEIRGRAAADGACIARATSRAHAMKRARDQLAKIRLQTGGGLYIRYPQEQRKRCSVPPTRGDSQSTRVTPDMSRKISTTRRNLVSSIRSKRRSPSHVPATTAGKHQK